MADVEWLYRGNNWDTSFKWIKYKITCTDKDKCQNKFILESNLLIGNIILFISEFCFLYEVTTVLKKNT